MTRLPLADSLIPLYLTTLLFPSSMRLTTRSAALALAGAAVLAGFVPSALAHGDEADMNVAMSSAIPGPEPDGATDAPSYFSHPDHRGLMFAHIGFMALAWIFVLPIGKNAMCIDY